MKTKTKRAAVRWFGPSPEVRALVRIGVPGLLRPGRAALTGVLLLVLSGMTLVLLAAVAVADPNPCTERHGGGNACRQDNPAVVERDKERQQEEEKDEAARKKARAQAGFDKLVAERKEEQSVNKGVLSAFNVRDRDGSPVAAYEVQADTGDWKQWDLKVQNILVQWTFQVNLWLVCFACWLIAWALSFSLAALLLRPVMHVSDTLYNNVLVQMGLPTLFLTFAGVVAGWHWMFGNKARGWGEMTAALVISALAVGALAAPASLLLSPRDGAVGQARSLSVEIAALALADLDPGTDSGSSSTATRSPKQLSDEISRPITDALVDVFVVRSSMLLSYGQVFTGDCSRRFRDVRIAQAVYTEALEEAQAKRQGDGVDWLSGGLKKIPGVGDWLAQNRRDSLDSWLEMGGEDTEEKVFEEIIQAGPIQDFEKKCVKGSAKAAKKASPEKTIGVLFLVLATLIVVVFIVVLVAGYLNAQFWLAAEAAIAKVALAVGVLPGPGRAWLWARATSIGKWLAMMVVSIAGLAVFIVVISALIETKEKDLPGGIVIRFIIIDFAAIAGFIWRKKLMQSVSGLSHRARSRLGSSKFGGAPSSTPAPAPRTRGAGAALAAAAFLTAGPVTRAGRGLALGGGSSARWAAGRGLRHAAGGAVRGTAQTAGVMARGVGITAHAAGAGARAVGTSTGRHAVRARAGALRSRLAAAVGTGLPGHVPGSAQQLRARMNRMRQARAAQANLGNLRAARARGAGQPGSGGPRSTRARSRAAGGYWTPPSGAPTGGNPQGNPGPTGGNPGPQPAGSSGRFGRRPPRPRFVPPTSGPRVMGPSSPLGGPRRRRRGP